MNYHDDYAAYEASFGAQAAYEAEAAQAAQAAYEAECEEAEAFNQYLDSLIYQEKFRLLSIEICLDIIRRKYSENSGKTVVEFLQQERTKLIEFPTL
jgi:hypothetical protein